MLDTWFWMYGLRVLVVTIAMVAIIYGVYFWLKAKGLSAARQQNSVHQPVKPPTWLLALQQRFGMAPLSAMSSKSQQADARHYQNSQKQLQQPVLNNSLVTLTGAMPLGEHQHVGVVSIGDKHWVVATGNDGGVKVLAETSASQPELAKSPSKEAD